MKSVGVTDISDNEASLAVVTVKVKPIPRVEGNSFIVRPSLSKVFKSNAEDVPFVLEFLKPKI